MHLHSFRLTALVGVPIMLGMTNTTEHGTVLDDRGWSTDPRLPGEVWHDSYWGSDYEVLTVWSVLETGWRWMACRTLGEDRVRTHCTPLNGGDYRVTETDPADLPAEACGACGIWHGPNPRDCDLHPDYVDWELS